MKKRQFLFMLRIIVAIILIQTLRFKFTAHPDSVYIFETIGLEPVGRIGIGVLELVAGVLLIFKRTAWAGSLLAFGLMGGAIMIHLTQLGIEVGEDHGVLFITAVITFVLSAILLWNHRKEIPFTGQGN